MNKNNSLINFSNAEFGNVRAILIGGEPWFVSKDVAAALGYSNTNDALKRHVPDKYKKDGVAIHDPIGRKQKPVLINEAGLYKLVMRSQLDSAEKFSDWVCEDVLPSIRKTGTYSVQDDPRWAQTRQNTKISHKPFTYAIKLMIDYLKDNCGKDYNHNYVYGKITNIVQNACGIIKGQHDGATVANLNKCDMCQNMIAGLILNIIALGKSKSLADFEAQILLQLSNLNNLLCGQPVYMLNAG